MSVNRIVRCQLGAQQLTFVADSLDEVFCTSKTYRLPQVPDDIAFVQHWRGRCTVLIPYWRVLTRLGFRCSEAPHPPAAGTPTLLFRLDEMSCGFPVDSVSAVDTGTLAAAEPILADVPAAALGFLGGEPVIDPAWLVSHLEDLFVGQRVGDQRVMDQRGTAIA